ncbi:hypothetical protein KM043_004444 [Ampulex compressa]|nr:hypothetical protein KM043_004444 [Ampulex compressa]
MVNSVPSIEALRFPGKIVKHGGGKWGGGVRIRFENLSAAAEGEHFGLGRMRRYEGEPNPQSRLLDGEKPRAMAPKLISVRILRLKEPVATIRPDKCEERSRKDESV